MRHVLRIPRSAFAATALALAAACASARPEGPVRLTIVHTNDMHAHVENFAAVASVARQERERNPNTLFLDAGDCITGTPVSTVFKGVPIFEITTLMGYDAGTLGNHEFDHGWRAVEGFVRAAGYPILCANAKDPEGRPLGDAPYRVFERGGVRVGVIGLLTDGLPTLVPPRNVEGCTVESPIAAARRLVPEVRRECDLVVLLTHVGVEADAALAGAVPGIDLIVGGHSHTELKEPLQVGGTWIVQARSQGTRVGVVDLGWDPAARRAVAFKARLVEVDPRRMPNAPDVKALVDEWQARTEEKANVSEVIGRTDVKLDRQKLRVAIERIYAETLGTQFGFQNAGGIRAEIAAGEIRVRDVWTVLPFDNTLVKVRLAGEEVPAFARKRLGGAFDPAKEYEFATNSYVAEQQETYFRTTGAPVEESGISMRDAVVDWVRRHGGFDVRTDAPAREAEPSEK